MLCCLCQGTVTAALQVVRSPEWVLATSTVLGPIPTSTKVCTKPMHAAAAPARGSGLPTSAAESPLKETMEAAALSPGSGCISVSLACPPRPLWLAPSGFRLGNRGFRKSAWPLVL